VTQLFGWISSIAFGICAIPQAYQSFKDGHSNGVTKGLLWLWTIGEWAGIGYAICLKETPLLFNYGLNAVFVGIITWYRFFPRKPKETK